MGYRRPDYSNIHLDRKDRLEWVDDMDPYASPMTGKEIALATLCGIGGTIMFFGALISMVSMV